MIHRLHISRIFVQSIDSYLVQDNPWIVQIHTLCITYITPVCCHGYRYLMQNIEWLQEQLGDHDDDYFLFDCPGEYSDITCHSNITITSHCTVFGSARKNFTSNISYTITCGRLYKNWPILHLMLFHCTTHTIIYHCYCT